MKHQDWHNEIPLLEHSIYLATCSRSPLSRVVQRGIQDYLESWNREGMVWDAWLEVMARLKAEIARLINAQPEHIAISTSASSLMSGLAGALDWEQGKNEVVLAEGEFPSLHTIFQAQERWGARKKTIPDSKGSLSLEAYAGSVDEKTLLLLASHVLFQRGHVQDMKALATIAHDKGAYLLLNACLSAGSVPIDVQECPVDILVGTTSKYLMGPPGLAFMYVAPHLSAQLRPAMTGWFGQEYPFSFEPRFLDYAGGARRFETGTPPLLSGYGSLAGLQWINTYGPTRIAEERQEMIQGATKQARDMGLNTVNDDNSLFISIHTPAARQIERRLKEKDIIVSAAGEYLRLSPHFYTQVEELHHALTEVQPLAGTVERETKPKVYTGTGTEELDLLLKNGQVVIPGNGVFHGDVGIKGGRIAALGTGIERLARECIDVEGKHVLPGMIDPHIHLGLFAPLEEDLKSETASALIGGVTTAGLFLGGGGSHMARLEELSQGVLEHAHIDIWPHLVINEGEQLEELEKYVQYGVGSFKMYMCGIPGLIPDADDGFIYTMLQKMQRLKLDGPLCIHAENAALVQKATEDMKRKIKDGGTLAHWTETHPGFAEAEAVSRALYLNRHTEVPLYFVHISSKEAMDIIARERGETRKYPFYAETTPFYLGCNNTDPAGLLAKMIPPLREQDSVEALWEGIQQGHIDTIGTDNTTQDLKVKNVEGGMWGAMPGYPALATSLPVLLHEGVFKGRISIEQVSMLMSRRPAEIFNLYPRKGSLLPGSDADIVIIDLKREKKVHHSDLKSRADFSVFEGRVLKGWPVMTIKNGQVVMKDGVVMEEAQQGSLLLQKP